MGSSAAKVKSKSARGALKGPGDPAPIRVAGNAPGVLAIHGFGGTPLEIALVTDVARSLGHAALAPLLPGHGTHADDLALARFEHWSAAAEAALDELAPAGGPAIVVGLSLGSVLATHLALAHPDRVKGLVLLANAFRLKAPFPDWALYCVERFKIPDFRVPKVAADIADPEARRTHLTYGEHPAHAAVAVRRAGPLVESRLGEIRVPTLIVHGARDRVCPVANATRVASRLGSHDVKVVILPRSRHIVTRDVERAAVERELRAFIERVAART
jgi:carboxylesterase